MDSNALQCWSCLPGQVSYTSVCTACENSCATCSSIGFYDCHSCNSGRTLQYGMCECNSGTQDTLYSYC